MITVITARGISEPYGNNMLAQVTKKLDKKKYKVVELDYSASYASVRNESFGFSQEVGRREMRYQIEKAEGKVILLGFSAGAKLAGDVAKSIADGVFPGFREKVVAVGLIADPARSRLQIQGKDRGGYGITGDRFIPDTYFKVWQFSAPGDPISELPAGNALRTFADFTEFASTTNPGPWFQNILEKTKKNQWQQWWNPANIATWRGAGQWLMNYLVGRRHISYHIEQMEGFPATYTERLAQLIGIYT